MTPEPIGAFVIVINSQNKILLGKRKNAYKAGLYGCPGGRLELEEAIETCATRELFEETGLQARSVNYLGVIRELQNGYNFIHFCFTCTDYEGDLTLKEPEKCQEWTFFEPNHIPSLILPAHQAGIQLLNKSSSTTLIDILNVTK